MKITDLRFRYYRWPRERPISNGRFTFTHAGACAIEIVTDEGLVGLGLSLDPVHPEGHRIYSAIVESLRDALVGQDPLDHERLWAAMWEPKILGRRGVETRVIGVLDIALWDLKGKITGLSVHKLLGGFADHVPFYVAGGYYIDGRGLDELGDEARDSIELGARGVKMKIGRLRAGEDAERVRVVRDAIGDDALLMVDANGAYSAAEAIRIARLIERYDIYWFEEPVRPDDYRGHEAVVRATSIPVAAGENESTKYGFRDLIDTGVAVLNADAQVLGGITEFMKVAALAQAHHVAIAPHGNQEIHVHLVAAIPNGLIVEYYRETTDPMWGRFLREHLIARDGRLTPSGGPGFGIEINDEAMEPWRVA